MEVIKFDIQGLLLIQPDVFEDNRGYFYESYSKRKFHEFGLDVEFVQDNISKSTNSTIRGLHYQVGDNAQGKLCQVLKGKVMDTAVDIRFNSPTFGKHVTVELSDENKRLFWIPAGFAHGFSVISDEAIFYYKCTAFYSKPDERTIMYNDADLCIDWKVKVPNVSEKDLKGISFKNINKDFFV
jgi:dTDP-4-dehydrorhamnose 3,5-epimerase